MIWPHYIQKKKLDIMKPSSAVESPLCPSATTLVIQGLDLTHAVVGADLVFLGITFHVLGKGSINKISDSKQ